MRAIVVAVAVLLAGGLVQAQEKSKNPETAVPKAAEAPKIDGSLDDAAWQKAVELKDLKDPDGAAVKTKTRVLLAQDDKNLYIAVENFEDADKIKKLVADIVDHDGEGIWEDDSVEFFIDPTNRRKAYYHVIVNSKNTTWDSVHMADDSETGDAEWNPKVESKAKVGEKSWVVEMAIPFEAFDRTANANGEWAFNFLRNRKLTDGGAEYIYWSPTGGSAHAPDKFGTLTGMATWKERAVAKKIQD